MASRRRTTGTTSERGYGWGHQVKRAAIAASLARGEVLTCWRCGGGIVHGMYWDLGHDDHDRTLYRGPEHRRCNRAAAARAKNRGRRRSRTVTRPWTAGRW